MANLGRDAGVVPRLDGLTSGGAHSTWPLDSASQQTYTLDGTDPDDAVAGTLKVNSYGQLPLDWGFTNGLAFAHVEVSGAFPQLLSGEISLNSFAIFEAASLYPTVDKIFGGDQGP